MHKMAILTIDSPNYGNKLQNYALQTAIQNLGHSVETLRRQRLSTVRKIKRLARIILIHDNRSAFYRFARKMICWSKWVASKNCQDQAMTNAYETFVIGSDQIWNIDFDFIGDVDFLPFIPREQKISYAASFGIDTIPESERPRIAAHLQNIRTISVREKSGAKIVKELTGRDAVLVLDPTLLLPKEDWIKIEKPPQKAIKKPYLLTYFLGKATYAEEVNAYAKAHNLEVVDCRTSVFPVGPSEFVYLVHHADVICTDSFHASVFSFIFKRPFAVFERMSHDQDMSSRIDDLCSTFHLDAHRFRNADFSWDNIGTFEPAADQVWMEKRFASLQFLKNNLGRTNTTE